MQKILLNHQKSILLLLFVSLGLHSYADVQRTNIRLSWQTSTNRSIQGKTYPVFMTLDRGLLTRDLLPQFAQSYALQGTGGIKVSIENAIYTAIDPSQLQNSGQITNGEPVLSYSLTYEKKMPQVAVFLIPFRKVNGRLERLEQFTLVISSQTGVNNTVMGKKGFTSSSVLSQGVWYKIQVKSTGIHKINKAFLTALGISTDELDPRTLKIYGNGPGMLPTPNAAARPDDLQENAIVVEGETDGVWNDDDQLLFYGKAQKDVWTYDTGTDSYVHQNNVYADATTYFLTYGGVPGKRISTLPVLVSNQNNDGTYDYLQVHESDLSNLIRSGRRWVGEEFNREPVQSFTVNLENADLSKPYFIRSVAVARCFAPSAFAVKMNGTLLFNHPIETVTSDYTTQYAKEHAMSGTFNAPSQNLQLEYSYNQPLPGALGWLDYFEIQSRNFLSLNKGQLFFKDKKSIGAGKITHFAVNANANTQIWDVTIPYQVGRVPCTFAAGSQSFNSATDTLKEFIAFDGSNYLIPEAGTKVANQNLHGLSQATMLIVSHENFLYESNRIADWHRSQGMSVHVMSTGQIYNEFSSGSQDITAIRDMVRMFYTRATTPAEFPKYLLLMGRASYDYKTRIAGNTNYVPTFESWNSFHPLYSFCSDDYFGLLDDNEGNMGTGEKLDIGIGRIPATNPENAAVMINKIIRYQSTPDRGDWVNRLVFVADDEDGNIHQTQADALAELARTQYRNYNTQKIYLDAFKEVTTAGGARNPDAQTEIVRSVERGCLIMNYTGHGGEVGWAEERVLNTNDVQNWTNGGKLPLFFTATCEFSRFDDPVRFSAGEYVLTNANGGGVGLCTTVRLVDAGNNASLNTAFFNHVGLDSAGAFNRMTLGEIMRRTKNDVLSDNSRNFTLLGDPAMMLSYPKLRIQTTLVDNTPLSLYNDTLKAFSKVTISGRITDLTGNPLNTFNGKVYPTMFDKLSYYNTVVNNPESNPFTFAMQNNVMFRGASTVSNGQFTFSFIVPKDIGYQVGKGRISYFAEDGKTDASGNDNSLLVGGTADSVGVDEVGPEIKLYLNDEKFVFGGLTDENPLLIAKLKDLTGINITGVGIGRDLGMTLNNDNTTTISINDYYRAKTDSYQEGEVQYRMKALPPGKNSVKLTAWDVYNNYNESVLEFIVASSAEMAIQHVLNYPNPFTTHTTFHFDHNKPEEQLKVMIQIFTISGKLVKTLLADTYVNGSHFDQLTWDGRDEFGDIIGKGVYVYKVKVKAGDNKTTEAYQKLVLLN